MLAVAAERGELAQPIVPGLPDLLAEAVHRGPPRAGARRWPTCCCAAPGSGCSPRAEVSGPGSEVPERVARALAAELGWDDARTAEEAERFRTNAAAEGILPG